MYTPTTILAFDIDEQEKIFKPGKVQENLDNVSRETKSLGDAIKVNKNDIALNKKASQDDRQSFRKSFLDI
tara:strand:+ start:194 stop:406 length:213 start_codon:yes stop_codon:yes gene_type:complete